MLAPVELAGAGMHKLLRDLGEVALIIWRYLVWATVTASLFIPAFLIVNDFSGGRKHSALIAVVAVFLVFSLICVGVHEMGHALAALVLSYHVHFVVVGPIGYRPAARKFCYVYRWDSGDFGGYVFATPASNDGYRQREAIFVAGGPMASLVFAAIVYSAAGVTGSHTHVVLASLAMMSFAIGALSLVPFVGSRDSPSDGALLVQLMRGAVPTDEALRSSQLWGLYTDELSPKEWDARVVSQIESGPVSPRYEALRNYMLLKRYLAVGEFLKGKALLDAVETIESDCHPSFLVEHAFLTALLEQDAARAEAYLARVSDKAVQDSFNYRRAYAVVYAAASRWAEALSAVEAARRLAEADGLGVDEDDELIFSAIERRELPKIAAAVAAS